MIALRFVHSTVQVGSVGDEERRLEIVAKYLLDPLALLRDALDDAGLLGDVLSLEVNTHVYPVPSQSGIAAS